MALAMEKWDLHKRIALFILLRFKLKPANILLGFMITTAFLSMWISNTATTMMMVPIALAIILQLEGLLGKASVKNTRSVFFWDWRIVHPLVELLPLWVLHPICHLSGYLTFSSLAVRRSHLRTGFSLLSPCQFVF